MSEIGTPLSALLIGCGVIGSVYGGQIALAGHRLWVLSYGGRKHELRQGIRLHDLGSGIYQTVKVELAQSADEREYDLVLVAVPVGRLDSTFPALRLLRGSPHIIFLGNNPEGHAAIPGDLPGTSEIAFPGVGGSLQEGVVGYAHIAEQPTTFEANASPLGKKFQAILESQGFKVQRTANMDGWLQYHAVLISCISAALLKSGTDSAKLGNDPKLLNLMCRAIEAGFQALRIQHVKGLPLNLRILHSALLRPIARRYWGKLLRSPKGELFFAGHVRHSSDEVQNLAQWTLAHAAHSQGNTGPLKILMTSANP
jgi:ketopantoate reductase